MNTLLTLTTLLAAPIAATTKLNGDNTGSHDNLDAEPPIATDVIAILSMPPIPTEETKFGT